MVMPIPYLERPITHICSLHCDGCSAYSNHNLKLTVLLAEARQWLKEWSVRIVPAHFRILGDEPFLHPNLPENIFSARQYWSATQIQVCTNGMNIDCHPTVPSGTYDAICR
jgi:molybdenum cofactor biosynthesis enzyme MoaA